MSNYKFNIDITNHDVEIMFGDHKLIGRINANFIVKHNDITSKLMNKLNIDQNINIKFKDFDFRKYDLDIVKAFIVEGWEHVEFADPDIKALFCDYVVNSVLPNELSEFEKKNQA